MKISALVEWLQLYMVVGETPKGWAKNDVNSPSTGGWSNYFVIETAQPGQRIIFSPYTGEGWEVARSCYELEKTREPTHAIDRLWMFDTICKAIRKSKQYGFEVHVQAAELVLAAFGMKMPEDLKPTSPVIAPTPSQEREPKANRRAGLTSVALIAERLAIDAKEARTYLRKANVEKPIEGWCGDDKWAASIEAVLVEALKNDPKKKKAAG